MKSLLLLALLVVYLARPARGDCSPVYASVVCSGIQQFNSPSGNLSSNSGDGMYTKNLDCAFLITAPAGQVVTLTVDSLSSECGYDFLFVHDGDKLKSPLIASLSGEYTSATLPKFYSTGNTMMLEFVSDSNLEEWGFRAHYTTSVCPDNCSGRGSCTGGVCVCPIGSDGLACEHEWPAVPLQTETNPCWLDSLSQTDCYCNTSLPLDYPLFTRLMGTYDGYSQVSPAPEYLVRCAGRPAGNVPCRFCPRPFFNQTLYVTKQCQDPSLSCMPRCDADESCWALLQCCYCPTCGDSTSARVAGIFAGVIAGAVALTCIVVVVLVIRQRRRSQMFAMHAADDGNPAVIVPPRDVLTIMVVEKPSQRGKTVETLVYRPMEHPGVILNCSVLAFPRSSDARPFDETGFALGSVLDEEDEHGERVPEPDTGTGDDTGDDTGDGAVSMRNVRQRESSGSTEQRAPPVLLPLPVPVPSPLGPVDSDVASSVHSSPSGRTMNSSFTPRRTPSDMSMSTTLSPMRLDLESLVRSSDDAPSSRDRSGNMLTSSSRHVSARRTASVEPVDEDEEVCTLPGRTPRSPGATARSARERGPRTLRKGGVRVNNFVDG